MEAGKSNLEISEFLLRACHDLRSPARAVRIHSELFLKQAGTDSDPALQERLGYIVNGTQRIDKLLDGLATYSVALRTNPASFQSIRMDVLLRSVLAKLSRELRESGAEVSYTELPTVTGAADQLMQVLENLLRNAIDHRGEAAPRIEISASPLPDEWLLAVRDNGPGVEPESLASIFRPFERLRSKDGGGAGLGLSVCHEILARHDGRIWAEANPDGGLIFYFTLPAR